MNVWVIYTYGPHSSYITGVAKSLTSAIRLAKSGSKETEWERLGRGGLCGGGSYVISGKWRAPFFAGTHDGYFHVTHRITRHSLPTAAVGSATEEKK